MIGELFPGNLKNVPRKKFRGKKRYFKKLLCHAKAFSLSLGKDDQYEMWHTHADWEGWSNLGWSFRFKHIEALCIIFKRLAEDLKNYHQQYQLWICLNQDDASQDAIFFHTQNSENFPCKFPQAEWGIPLIEDVFRGLLPSYEMRAGKQQWNHSKIFYIYSSELGKPLE